MEGYPYGYHNFLFGWIDLPEGNLPPVLDKNLIMVVFSFIERLYEYPIKRIMTESLNMRLGTKGLKMADIAVELSKRNMTLADLMALPERDGWYYSDGYSYVCSSFVAAVYQAGGLLKDIEGTELTPKDVIKPHNLGLYLKHLRPKLQSSWKMQEEWSKPTILPDHGSILDVTARLCFNLTLSSHGLKMPHRGSRLYKAWWLLIQ